jgi:ABC-type antimicrobial peptide transport system permease subunit
MTVVGVVSDVRQALRETALPMAYQPLDQLRFPPDYIVGAIRTTEDPVTIAGGVRGIVAGLGGGLAVSWVRSQREQMRAALATERLLAGLSTIFGLLALGLAAVGVHGVIAYDVTRRTREIGIRMALGARQGTVLATVLRQVGWIVVPGVAAGVFASLQASSAVEKFLFGITPRDPWTLAMTALVLTATGFAAAWLPARRASRIDPALTLRNE